MTRAVSRDQLTPLDINVVRDVVRFGVLTDDQICRRYTDPAQLTDRLDLLCAGGWIAEWKERVIHNARVFSATPTGAGVARCGLRATRPSFEHLRHDLAVVDLADHLLGQDPSSEWRTEREAGRFLRGTAHRPRHVGDANGAGHRPDGLLLVGGRCIAVELEHSDKGDHRYARICRWFARTLRIDAVRWYVDDERISARIRRVSAAHGFAADVDVTYAPFPVGVAMRPLVRP